MVSTARWPGRSRCRSSRAASGPTLQRSIGRSGSDPLSATLLLQIVLSGLVTGLIYMLIALGVTLLFGIMRVVNFVHGELVMLSAFAVYFLGSQEAGLPFWAALLAAIAAAGAVGVVCQYLL